MFDLKQNKKRPQTFGFVCVIRWLSSDFWRCSQTSIRIALKNSYCSFRKIEDLLAFDCVKWHKLQKGEISQIRSSLVMFSDFPMLSGGIIHTQGSRVII